MFSEENLHAHKHQLSVEFNENMMIYMQNKILLDKTFGQYKKIQNKYYHLHSYRSELYTKYYESVLDFAHPDMVVLNKKIGKISHLIHNAYRDSQLLKFEMEILEYNSDIYCLGYNKTHEKISTMLLVNKNNSKTRYLTKAKSRWLEEQDCSICMDKHKITDIITTSCGHSFGKTCFEKLMHIQSKKNCAICCPLCRTCNLDFIMYRKNK